LHNSLIRGEKMSQTEYEYKEIEDITDVVKQKVQNSNFPKTINIISAKLLLGPDGWGSYAYFISIVYEIDGVEHKITQMIYANASETLMHMIDQISDYYERTHVIK